MKLLALAGCLLLTGCATVFDSVATYYDRNDPCQTGQYSEAERQRLNRPQGYTQPAWCGAGQGRTYIYNTNNQRIGYIK